MKRHPDWWRELLALESRINKSVLSREDETTPKDALSDYREFFLGMVTVYEMSNTFPLFSKGIAIG
jgi:hypothetical protein